MSTIAIDPVSLLSDSHASAQVDRSDSRPASRRSSSLPRLAIALFALAALACAPASDEAQDVVAPDTAAAQALRDTLTRRIAEAYDFTRPDVVERMSALYPDTGRVISASGGYVTTTADSLRQGLADFWANVGVNMREPTWEWGDIHVDRLSDDAAVLTATWSIPHIAPTGNPHTIRGAWTAVFRRMNGEWKIIQEHLSVPPQGQ
jgi:ketosteroid isomerase-like protein